MSQVECKLWCSYVDVFHLVLEDTAQEVLAEFSSFFMKMTSMTRHRLSVSACFGTCLGIRHCCCGWCCLDCSCLKTSLGNPPNTPHPMPGLHICALYMSGSKAKQIEIFFLARHPRDIYIYILAVARQISCFSRGQKGGPQSTCTYLISRSSIHKCSQQECD